MMLSIKKEEEEVLVRTTQLGPIYVRWYEVDTSTTHRKIRDQWCLVYKVDKGIDLSTAGDQQSDYFQKIANKYKEKD